MSDGRPGPPERVESEEVVGALYLLETAAHRAVSFRDAGEGSTLLQVHGLGTGRHNFDLLTPRLSKRLHVVDVDLPGYGESQALPSSERSLDAYADAVADFISAMGLAPVAVHGCSMGGCIALSLAARYPSLVDRLVVSVSFARIDRAGVQVFETWRSAAAYGGGRALGELTSQQGFSRAFWDTDEAEATKQAFIDALESTSTDEFLRDLDLMVDIDFGEYARAIEAPTLLLGADEDVMCPVEAAPSGIGMTGLNSLIRGSRLEVLPQSGHFLVIEHPDEVAASIFGFLGA